MLACCPVTLADSGDLRHPGARNHTRGANGSGTDPHLNRICPSFDQRLAPSYVATFPAISATSGNRFLTARTASRTRD